MNDLVATYKGKDLHVILDNLSTHKPKDDRWLKRHPDVQFHFTPTRASWLNQVETWFSILEGKSLGGASFTSVKQLQRTHRCFHRPLQSKPHAVCLDQSQSQTAPLQRVAAALPLQAGVAGGRRKR